MSDPEFSKVLISPGRGSVPDYKKNSKVYFHFRTFRLPALDDGEEQPMKRAVDPASVIDDTRTMGCGAFELLIGREFKLDIWEEMVRTMQVNEIARFICPFKRVIDYPTVSKALRDLAKQKAGEEVAHHHGCSMAVMTGTGHSDLDKIIEERSPLCFEFELMKIEQPGEYKQDHWAMTEAEKNKAIPVLKEEGNALYKTGKYREACKKYFEALSYIEEQVIREKPQSEEWEKITKLKIPFLLNYSQCQLLLEDYAEVIRHTSMVLEIDQDNIKALFRRGKANAACWNTEEATVDLERAAQLDATLRKVVDKELKRMIERVKEKDAAERERLKGKIF